MKTLKITGRLMLIHVMICSGVAAEIVNEADVDQLVRRLPANWSAERIDRKLIETIAALGDPALPSLEKELRLGIRFKELNLLSKGAGSRRGAVVQVLQRMPSDRSTALLVASLDDPPDNYGMTVGTLLALSKRKLNVEQVLRMLKNQDPEIVLAGIVHATLVKNAPQTTEAVEKIFDKDQARVQFRNEYGAATAGEDILWQVRLAAGQALDKDMVPEMRSRATDLIAVLKAEATVPSSPDVAEKISNASKAENTICRTIHNLAALGEPVKSLVEDEARLAQGDYASILAMALVSFGDRSKVAQVADDLVASKSHTIRYCAAVTLRISGDRSALPALRKAMRDPYQRLSGGCNGDGMIYPVRWVVADALIELGDDPGTVRKQLR